MDSVESFDPLGLIRVILNTLFFVEHTSRSFFSALTIVNRSIDCTASFARKSKESDQIEIIYRYNNRIMIIIIIVILCIYFIELKLM